MHQWIPAKLGRAFGIVAVVAALACEPLFATAREASVTARELNLRAGPSARSPIVGRLKNGDRVQILERYGAFLRIRIGSAEAFVAARYVVEVVQTVRPPGHAKELFSGLAQKLTGFLHTAWLTIMRLGGMLPVKMALLSLLTTALLKLCFRRLLRVAKVTWTAIPPAPSLVNVLGGHGRRWLLAAGALAVGALVWEWRVIWAAADVVALLLLAGVLITAWRTVAEKLRNASRARRTLIHCVAAGFVGYTLLAAGACIFDAEVKDGIARLSAPVRPAIVYTSGTSESIPLPQQRASSIAEVRDSWWMKALIAIEDRRLLWRQGPLDVYAMIRAAYRTLSGRREGGSGIALQVAKLLTGVFRSRFVDKPRQVLMALRFSELYRTPEEQVAVYSNLVSICGDRRGVAVCAAEYFHVADLRQLTPAQAALLAGLLRNPNFYNPRTHPARALQRRNLVLAAMLDQGYLTKDQYEDEIATPIVLHERDHGDEMLLRAAGKFGKS